MKTPFAPCLHRFCTSLAAALLLAAAASAADLAVRVIDRSPDVRNLDTTDTLKWYADESIDYTVRPRRGKESLSIPGDATATWIIADAATGTNYLSAVAASQTSNSVTFHLPLGGAALPEGVDEWVSFVSLLQGTNFLGVIDRCRAECLWSPYTSAAALVPTNPLPELLRQFATTSSVAAALAPIQADIQGIADDLAHQAQDIAAIEEDVADNTARLDELFAECVGGYRYPDWLSLEVARNGMHLDGAGWITGYQTNYNVVVSSVTGSMVSAYRAAADIVRSSDFDARPAFASSSPDIVFDGDTFYAASVTGTVAATISATLGGYVTNIPGQWEFERHSHALAYRIVGPAQGTLLADAHTSIVHRADTRPGGNSLWAFNPVATNSLDWYADHARRSTNFWAGDPADFACLSLATDGSTWRHYKAATLITPQHCVGAAHFFPAAGSRILWIGQDGTPQLRTLSARRTVIGDIVIGLLDSPIPTNSVPPAALLGGDETTGYFRGTTNAIANSFYGWPVVEFGSDKRAYLSYAGMSSLTHGDRTPYGSVDGLILSEGVNPETHRRKSAIGGDSGHPIFLYQSGLNGGRPVLLGCFHTAATFPPLYGDDTLCRLVASMDAIGNTNGYALTYCDYGRWPNPDLPLPP